MKSEWQNIILSELGTIQTGKTPAGNIKDAYGIGIPFITPKDMDGRKYIRHTERYLTVAGINSIKNYVIPKNSVSVSCIGSDMGKVIMTDKDSVTNQQINSIIVNIDKHEPEYIYYNLSSRRQELKKMAGGTTMPIINKTDFSKINIQLPPLPTQKKIAHILSTLDDKIELGRKMNQTLEAMAQALFKSWFVDFDPVHVKLTCKSEEELNIAAKKLGISKEILDLFPNEFEESELGMIPKGWSVKKLGECELEIESGTRPKGGIDKELSFGTPSVGAESIAPIGIFDFSNVKYVTNEFAAKAKRGWVQNMDVALYKDGGKPGIFMPRVGLYGNGYPFARFMINEHVFLLRSLLLGQYYLFQLVSSKSILDQLIARGSAKAAQPGLNQVEVSESKFVLPSKELLSAFNNIIGTFIAKQLENGKQIQTLQKTRDTLLPKLLSGELDVSELELDI